MKNKRRLKTENAINEMGYDIQYAYGEAIENDIFGVEHTYLYTLCALIRKNDTSHCYIGIARKSHLDQKNKQIGLMKALGRAYSNMIYDENRMTITQAISKYKNLKYGDCLVAELTYAKHNDE